MCLFISLAFLLQSKSRKTYLGPMLLPRDRIWQLINPYWVILDSPKTLCSFFVAAAAEKETFLYQ
jgi:hypothetical protein